MSEPIVLHQKINLPYRYTAGEFHKAFLHGLAEQRIVGSRCADCTTLAVPARPFCPNCSARNTDIVDMASEAELVSWTTVTRLGIPRTFGLVRVAGADTVMLHFVEAGGRSLVEGLRLVPRWASDAVADITAIEAFVPE